MSPSSKSSHWVGFDLGGTKMLAVVYDDRFNILGRVRRKTRAHEGQRAGLDRILTTVRDALDAAGVDPANVTGIGVGSPGPLDLDRGVILDTPNLGWTNAPIKNTIENALNCPAFILNDVDAGVYGEYRFGAGKGSRCVVGIFPGTGIGGGCVYEGRIIRGQRNSVMEIGHMQVQPNGPLCGCGRRGCLEAVASRLAVSAAAAAAAHRGQAPNLLKNAGMDLANIRSSTLTRAIKAGDKAVEEIVKDAAQWLGIAIANVVNLLGPDTVVLGGGLVEALPKLVRDTADRTARARVMPSFENSFKVTVAELGDNAAAAGAAAWAAEMTAAK